MRRVLATVAVIPVLIVALAAPVAAHPHGAWDSEKTGTPKGDTISGGKGNDKIRGLAGKDDLMGGKGRDQIIAGPGKDFVRGGNGHDELFGGKGHDTLNGGNGPDILTGGAGDDKLLGGAGNDTINAAGDGGSDFVNCGKGTGDVANVDPRDTVTQCETVNVIL